MHVSFIFHLQVITISSPSFSSLFFLLLTIPSFS